MDLFLTAKALHVVGFISWFAGLFYLVRLFVYHAEAGERPAEERRILQRQLVLMQSRLWSIITTPAMLITIVAGATMVHASRAMPAWLVLKLGFVAALIAYHSACGVIRRRQAKGQSRLDSARLRLWNEVATVLMVAIVFIAVFKHAVGLLAGLLGIVAFGAVLFVSARLYRRSLSREVPERDPKIAEESRSRADAEEP